MYISLQGKCINIDQIKCLEIRHAYECDNRHIYWINIDMGYNSYQIETFYETYEEAREALDKLMEYMGIEVKGAPYIYKEHI